MAITTVLSGQIETITLEADTEVNVFGVTDSGIAQQRSIIATIQDAGTVYLKVIASTDTLTDTVASDDFEAALTSADGPVPFFLAPGTILVAVSSGTPTINVRELLYVS